jgi:fimbrial chaperone protein
MAFRLVLEDVTQTVTKKQLDAMQVEVRVNHNLPVFFAAAGNPNAEPRIMACGDMPAGRGCVRIENAGNQYVAVRTIALTNGDWQHDLPVSTRVLSGAWKQWEFDLPSHVSGSLQISAETSAGSVSGALPVN